MITEFKSGHWYRYIGPGKEEDDIVWNGQGKMDFLLDGKPHQCNKGVSHRVSFFDSLDPDYRWSFAGSLRYFEEVEMNEEMEQIQKLKKEIARLEGIVKANEEKKIIFDGDNLYVGIDEEGKPFLLVGYKDYLLVGHKEYYRFHSFASTRRGWEPPHISGQKAIDSALNDGPSLAIYEFSNALEGMEFFMDKYREYWG